MATTLLQSPALFSIGVFFLVAVAIPNSSAQNLSTYVGQGRSGYSDGHHHHHAAPHHIIHTTSHHGGGHGGHGGSHFSAFYDIVLTGLAFLSFGIFLLNLLLNAMTTSTGTGTVPLPTNTGTGIITVTADTGRSNRGKRDIFDLHLERFVSIEALAASVLQSIDAMVNEHECLSKVFCDGNKEARLIGSGFQFMMPAYSLGASYLGRKVGLHDSFSDHLKSVVLGFGESNCQTHFPQC